MSNPFVEKEIKKVLETAEYPKNMALASAWAIAHFKGINIKIFDVAESSSLCDYNIIATAENTIQARAMVDVIQKNLTAAGAKFVSIEGLSDSEWILVDLGDIIVHIFQELSRDVYHLETLWEGSPQVEIPSEFYFGPGNESGPTDSSENYF